MPRKTLRTAPAAGIMGALAPAFALPVERLRKYVMHLMAGLLAAATLTGLSASPSRAGPLTPPTVTIYERPGHYTAAITGDNWVLTMFAVGNPGNGYATGATNGWNSDSISQSDWDSGYPLSPLDFYFGRDDGYLTSDYFDTFANIFGPNAHYANTYWLNQNAAPPYDYNVIGPNTTQGGFTFGNIVASQFIALVVNPNDLTQTVMITGTATVPEPASLALFGLGLAGLGFARRRKTARRKPAG